MVENSPAGLVMLGAEVSVTVTREEHHQAVLARYPVRYGERQVAAELGWCVIRSGKHRGRRAIEVRLDGQRVGELTHLMSERYAPLVSQVASAGGRPGCAAVIQLGAKGLELTLRLPRDGHGTIPIPAYPVGAVPIPAYPVGPVPVGAPEPVRRRGLFSSYKPAWIAAAIVLIAFFAAIGNSADDPSPSTTSADSTTTTTTPPVTTTTTTPPPTTTAAPAPPAPRTTTEPPAPAPPPVKPKPKPAPKPEPEPVSDCDPNYGGCVPVASDVDCAGGSGNGPAYVAGPVQVTGNDIYGLDRDGDGTGCD